MLRNIRFAGFDNGFSSCRAKSYCSFLNVSSMASVDILKRKLEDIPSNGENSKKQKKNEEQSLDNNVQKTLETSNRIRKPKKVVLLLCYLGKNYFGMQRNMNVSTVEEDLLKALLNANVVLQSEFEFPKTMRFQRAARTDKGVSAVRQIVSLKIPINDIAATLPEKINKYLPPEVRVLGVKRVTQSFDAKIACDARTYCYMLPTFAFNPSNNDHVEGYKISGDKIVEVTQFLQNFIGTHNFYNFTSGRLAGDPSCKRYIMSCECGPPLELCGLEFSVIKIKGQSFMLHQIRKMVGLTIAYMRNLADASVLQKSWLSQRIDIPKAPGLGLMLDELHYDWYNKKYGEDGIHEALKWNEYDDVVSKFKIEKICANIAKTERDEKSMIQWLETLPYHSYDVREAGPPELTFPKEAAATDTCHEMRNSKTMGDCSSMNETESSNACHDLEDTNTVETNQSENETVPPSVLNSIEETSDIDTSNSTEREKFENLVVSNILSDMNDAVLKT